MLVPRALISKADKGLEFKLPLICLIGELRLTKKRCVCQTESYGCLILPKHLLIVHALAVVHDTTDECVTDVLIAFWRRLWFPCKWTVTRNQLVLQNIGTKYYVLSDCCENFFFPVPHHFVCRLSGFNIFSVSWILHIVVGFQDYFRPLPAWNKLIPWDFHLWLCFTSRN